MGITASAISGTCSRVVNTGSSKPPSARRAASWRCLSVQTDSGSGSTRGTGAPAMDRRLSAFELRRALLDERPHGFSGILGLAEFAGQVLLVAVPIPEAHLLDDVQRALRHAHRN